MVDPSTSKRDLSKIFTRQNNRRTSQTISPDLVIIIDDPSSRSGPLTSETADLIKFEIFRLVITQDENRSVAPKIIFSDWWNNRMRVAFKNAESREWLLAKRAELILALGGNVELRMRLETSLPGFMVSGYFPLSKSATEAEVKEALRRQNKNFPVSSWNLCVFNEVHGKKEPSRPMNGFYIVFEMDEKSFQLVEAAKFKFYFASTTVIAKQRYGKTIGKEVSKLV